MIHKKILVVDDESEIAEELSEFLTSFDFPCDSAVSASDALAKIELDHDITLVMTDMRMPGKDGAALIKELKARDDREFEYVMISGHLDAEQDVHDIKGPDVALMRKPVSIEQLMEYLESRDFGTP